METSASPVFCRELRALFPDQELKKRDGHRKQNSYWGEMDGEYEETQHHEEDQGFSAEETFNEEGLILWNNTSQEIEEAMAMMQQAKRTLREARSRQHTMKLSRQYYKTNPHGGKGSGSAKGKRDEKMTCLRCGKVGHRAANCPEKEAAAHQAQEESAPFVCYAEDFYVEPEDQARATEVTTAQAVEQGKCVIDCGATRTIGSVKAIETMMAIRKEESGVTGVMEMDRSNRPVFGFGNSSSDQCISTVKMELKADGKSGSIQIHALDKGAGPVLLSVESLRRLGTVIDFENDYMVLRKINPSRLIPLERSVTGHQLLSLTQDLYSQSKAARTPIPALSEFFLLMPAE